MIITHQERNYFKLQSGNYGILINPLDQRSFKGSNLVINTKSPPKVANPESDGVFWIEHAGEYEVGGVRVRGWRSEWDDKNKTKKNVFRLELEGFTILLLGELEKIPGPQIQEEMGDIDTVITPVPSDSLLAKSELAKFIRQIAPGLVVLPAFKDIKKFLDDFSQNKCIPEGKVVVKRKDIKQEAMQIRCLK